MTLFSLSFDLLLIILFSFPLLLSIFSILLSLSFSLLLLFIFNKGFFIWIFSWCFLLLELFVNLIILLFVCTKLFGVFILFLFIFNAIVLLFPILVFGLGLFIFTFISLFNSISFELGLFLIFELELLENFLSSDILYISGEFESVIISLFFLLLDVFSTASNTSKACTKLSFIFSLSLLKVYPA